MFPAALITLGKVLPSLAMCFHLSLDLQGLIQFLCIIALEGVGVDDGVQMVGLWDDAEQARDFIAHRGQ